uniref:Uncharacterized protein n=1 Tax=Panagrellus redivivus TaxID=6233 RepID=A0A7E5A029_PANRE
MNLIDYWTRLSAKQRITDKLMMKNFDASYLGRYQGMFYGINNLYSFQMKASTQDRDVLHIDQMRHILII